MPVQGRGVPRSPSLREPKLPPVKSWAEVIADIQAEEDKEDVEADEDRVAASIEHSPENNRPRQAIPPPLLRRREQQQQDDRTVSAASDSPVKAAAAAHGHSGQGGRNAGLAIAASSTATPTSTSTSTAQSSSGLTAFNIFALNRRAMESGRLERVKRKREESEADEGASTTTATATALADDMSRGRVLERWEREESKTVSIRRRL